ncbi:MAG: pyridoxamine 5'-phosphate oxidase family protein [bacterium]|nr:pyridoxamine 5'-phosphate oxidase family protein [bacterium]
MKSVELHSIADEVLSVMHQQVWCAVGTVDPHNRPHVRLLHPIWEQVDDVLIGWIATNRHSPKATHLAHSAYASLCYDRDIMRPITLDCQAAWRDDVDSKTRLWEWFKATPAPLGYDPGLIWKAPDHADFGVLRLEPYRIVVGQLGGEWRMWKAGTPYANINSA